MAVTPKSCVRGWRPSTSCARRTPRRRWRARWARSASSSARCCPARTPSYPWYAAYRLLITIVKGLESHIFLFRVAHLIFVTIGDHHMNVICSTFCELYYMSALCVWENNAYTQITSGHILFVVFDNLTNIYNLYLFWSVKWYNNYTLNGMFYIVLYMYIHTYVQVVTPTYVYMQNII